MTKPRRALETAPVPLRLFAYLRISTGRQAEADLSIPDQRKQIEAWAAARGFVIVAEFVEPGASALDDKRPESSVGSIEPATAARQLMRSSSTVTPVSSGTPSARNIT